MGINKITGSQYLNQPEKYKYIGCYDRNTIRHMIERDSRGDSYCSRFGLVIVANNHRAKIDPRICAYTVYVKLS